MSSTATKIITRLTSRGHSTTAATNLLDELTNAHAGDNLVAVLAYWGITPATATRYANEVAA